MVVEQEKLPQKKVEKKKRHKKSVDMVVLLMDFTT
jgi:hypothetical protein